MSLPPIILPRYEAGNAPNVIRIGGHCYVLKPQRTGTPTTSVWDDVESDWSVCQECAIETSYTKLLLHADGDQSASKHNLTYQDGVKLDYIATPTGAGAFKFNRVNADVGAYISIPDSPDFDFGNSDFCIEFWTKPAAIENNIMFITQSNYVSSDTNYGFIVRVDTNKLRFSYTTDGTTRIDVASSADLVNDQWQHIAVSRSGSDLYLFINGVLDTTYNIGTASIYNSSRDLNIGAKRVDYSGGETWGADNGYMSDLRISKNTPRYTTDFTPPTSRLQTDANTVLLLSGKGDYGSIGHSITTSSGVIENSSSGYFDGAFQFDGSSNKLLTIPDHTDFDLSTKPEFTIECNVYLNGYSSSGNAAICAKRYYSPPYTGWGFTIGATGNVSFQTNDNTEYISSTPISLNTWYHLALVYDGTNIKLYINGVLDDSSALASIQNYATDFKIAMQYSAWSSINGYIDELRISDTARYTANFIPPTKPYADEPLPVYRIDQDTKLLIHGDGDLSNSRHNLTYNGGVVLDAIETPLGKGAYYFDGDANVEINSSTDWNFPGLFTIDFMLQVASGSTQNSVMLDKRGSSWDVNDFGINIGNTGVGEISFNYNNGSTQKLASTATVNDGNFHRVRICRDASNVLYLYIDEQLENSATVSTNFSNTEKLFIGSRDGGEYFTGYISNIVIKKGVCENAPTEMLEPDENTVLFLSGRSDYGTTGHSITTYNANQEQSNNGYFEGAFYFNGTNQYLSLPDNDDWYFGLEDFTVDCWVKGDCPNSYNFIIGKSYNGSAPSSDWHMWADTSGIVYVTIYSGSSNRNLGSTTSINDNKWHHLAMTRSNGVFRLFVDGKLENSDATANITLNNNSTLLYISNQTNSTGRYWRGYIDEIRISKGTATWTDSFIPPHFQYTEKPKKAYEIDQNTLLLLHNDGDLSDSGHNLTYNGNFNLDNVETPLGKGAYYFDGLDDYVKLSTANLLDSSNFTVEMYVYFDTNFATNSNVFFSQYQDNNNRFHFQYDNSGNYFGLYLMDGGSTSTYYSTTTWTPTLNTWYHIAFVKYAGNLYFYVNGVSYGSVTFSSIPNLTGDIWIGALKYNGSFLSGYGHKGHIADLRISDTARYTAAFTPPATRLENDSSTKLLLPCKGDYGATGHPITTHNGIQEQSNNGHFYGAFYFNGTNQYLSIPDSSDWIFGTNNFTIDGWIKRDNSDTEPQGIINQRGDGSATTYWSFYISDNKLWLHCANSGVAVATYNTTETITDTDWHHIAVVRNGTDITIYIDGDGSSTVEVNAIGNNSMPDSTYEMRIGHERTDTTRYFSGLIDELRVSNVARWMGNFKPFPFPYTDA